LPISKNVTRAAFYVMLVVVVIVGAELVDQSSHGSSPVYVVVSKSMVPTLQIGDLVVAQTVPFSSIHVGNVILYVPPNGSGGCTGETIVHRVVAITSQGLITQGDDRITNPQPDEPSRWPPVTPQCVKGEVVLAIPYLGWVSMVIHYPYNYLLVALLLVFAFLSEVRPGRRDSQPGQQ
jgi:signal peptidase I